MALTRRRFVATAAAAFAAPWFIPRPSWGQSARVVPSDRVAMGFIGVGGQGGNHLDQCLTDPGVQVVAVCDVDDSRRRKAKGKVESRYADQTAAGDYRGCTTYNEFRELLARPDIDAVLIAVPDHWHAIIAIAAAKAGKDIYCEKPLTHTVEEAWAVADAVQRFGRVLQCGSHERSGRGARYAVELIRNGRLGKVHTITVRLPTDDRVDIGMQPPMPVPAGFDYDTWLGPAPWQPYTEKRCHYSFRFINDYAEGEMTNRGAHVADIGLWACAPWLTGPVEILGQGVQYQHSLWDAFYQYDIEFKYASGLRILITHKGDRGLTFEGERGWINVAIHGGALTARPESLLKETFGPGDWRLPPSVGHREEFFRAMKTRGTTVANVDEGARTSAFCHLATIAMILRRKLRWDPAARRFIDDEQANRLLHRAYRSPWVL